MPRKVATSEDSARGSSPKTVLARRWRRSARASNPKAPLGTVLRRPMKPKNDPEGMVGLDWHDCREAISISATSSSVSPRRVSKPVIPTSAPVVGDPGEPWRRMSLTSLEEKASRLRDQQLAFEQIVCVSKSNLEQLQERLSGYVAVRRSTGTVRRKVEIPEQPISPIPDDKENYSVVDEVEAKFTKALQTRPPLPNRKLMY